MLSPSLVSACEMVSLPVRRAPSRLRVGGGVLAGRARDPRLADVQPAPTIGKLFVRHIETSDSGNVYHLGNLVNRTASGKLLPFDVYFQLVDGNLLLSVRLRSSRYAGLARTLSSGLFFGNVGRNRGLGFRD